MSEIRPHTLRWLSTTAFEARPKTFELEVDYWRQLSDE